MLHLITLWSWVYYSSSITKLLICSECLKARVFGVSSYFEWREYIRTYWHEKKNTKNQQKCISHRNRYCLQSFVIMVMGLYKVKVVPLFKMEWCLLFIAQWYYYLILMAIICCMPPCYCMPYVYLLFNQYTSALKVEICWAYCKRYEICQPFGPQICSPYQNHM